MAFAAQSELPYDAASREPDPETPTFDQVIAGAVAQGALRLRVMLPVQVVAVNGEQKVDVQPMLQARYTTQSAAQDLPILKNVPVLMPYGQQFLLRYPLTVGDNGMAIFCDRSLDAWSASTAQAPVDPQDTRHHNLSDAVFVPGLVPFGQMSELGGDALILRAGQAQVTLTQDGRLAMGSNASGGQELLDLLAQALQALSDLIETLATKALVPTMLGPQPFLATTVVALKQVQTTVQSIKTNLGTLQKE